MKKLLFLFSLFIGISLASQAQVADHKVKTEDNKQKTKPTTTVPQKVHNAIHPKHKKYSGIKAKQKTEK